MLKSLILILCLVATFKGVAEEAPASSGAKSQVFQEKMLKMNRLDEQIKSHEEEFRKLVIEKRQATDPKAKLAIIDSMKQSYAAYEKAMDELVALKKELKYRFPGDGEEALKPYSHVEKRSAEDLEKTADLSSTLSKAKMLVDEKYKSFMPPKPVRPKAEVQKEEELPVEKQRIRLER